MSESAGKHRKRYLYHPKGKSKTCHTHIPGHSSYKCKVLGYFGSRYVKIIPTRDRRHNFVPRKRFNKQQDNNVIVNNAVDEILLHENQEVSYAKEAHENVEYDFDENELYQVDHMSLENIKEKLEQIKRAFECKIENTYGIENQNDMTRICDNKLNNISECNLLHDIINPRKLTKI